jgi:hypothetical protein
MPVRAPVTEPEEPVFGRHGRGDIGCQAPAFGQGHASVRVGSAAMSAPFSVACQDGSLAAGSRFGAMLVAEPDNAHQMR